MQGDAVGSGNCVNASQVVATPRVDPSFTSVLQYSAAMNFDSTSFCRFLNKAGKGKDKAFRYQAMELIKICRVYSAASEQSHDQDRRLQE